MKRTLKRTLALVLALVMTVACLTGCGAKPEASAPAAAPEAAPVAAPEAAPVAAPEAEKEIVNIVVMNRNGQDQPGEADVIAALNEYSAEKIGVTITFQPVASGEYVDTLSRKLAAKDDLDVFWVNYAQNAFYNLVTKDAILDITDYVLSDEYKDLYATAPASMWDTASVNGRYYGVYNVKETPYQDSLITPVVLADTIKEKYGIDFNALEINSWRDLPKLEEYYDACVKEGIAFPALSNELEWLGHSLVSDPEYEQIGTDSTSPFVMNKQTHEVTNVFANPDFTAWFETMERWYENGYRGDDNIPLDWNYREQEPLDTWGTLAVSAVPDNAAQQTAVCGQPVYAINSGISTNVSNGVRASLWCVNANSAKVDAAMKWIQLIETDKTYADLYIYGIEGVHYTRDSEDVITKIPDSGWALSRWACCNVFLPSTSSAESANLKELYKEFNDAGIKPELAGFEADFSSVESEMAAINAVMAEVFHLYNMGVMTIDDVPNTLEKLNQAGAEKVIELLQSQVDAFFAK